MGVAETILGNNLKQGGYDRDDLIISTKLHPFGSGIQSLSRKRLRQGLDHSLRRLQLEYTDVLFLHRFDHSTPLKETIRMVNQFIDDDKVFYWGTSAFTPQQVVDCHTICEKHGWVAPIMEQCEYSMLQREAVERDYVPLFEKHGMGTTVWSPLAGGILCGKYNDGESHPGRFESDAFGGLLKFRFMQYVSNKKEQMVKTLQGLKAIADDLGCTQAQLALAWAIKNPDVSTAIVGASNPQQLNDSLGCIEVAKKLTPEVLERIESALGNRPTPAMNWRDFAPLPPRR